MIKKQGAGNLSQQLTNLNQPVLSTTAKHMRGVILLPFLSPCFLYFLRLWEGEIMNVVENRGHSMLALKKLVK